jgi:hypothetical protein
MMHRFPRKRLDGSFTILAKFPIIDDSSQLRAQVTLWLSEWVANHQDWIRSWQVGGDVKEEHLYYADDFKGPPYVVNSIRDQICIRFDCKSGAKWWKDWLARMVNDLAQKFPEIGRPSVIEDSLTDDID